MTNKLAKTGFTLIELLVVVLIIGILAGVALPQYNKAVRKARFAEVASTFNSISKGIDAWLLENGGYGQADFIGSDKTVSLDIAQSCTMETNACYTKLGSWVYFCDSSSCVIQFNSSANADGTDGNKWLDGAVISFHKDSGMDWSLYADTLRTPSVTPEICRWWKDKYGSQRITGGYGDEVSTVCDAY